MDDLRRLLRVRPGHVDLSAIDTRGTPGFTGKEKDGSEKTLEYETELVKLQSMLAAEAYTGGRRRVLVVVQGMDTSGKGGVLKHTVGLFDPGGVEITSFKVPTDEEKKHDFLWRVEKVLPLAGKIGIFDRSHYEDVLVVKVHDWAPPEEIERRYEAINEFEKRISDEGTTVVKFMLHISPEEQRTRLLARLDEPTKVWKFKPEDVEERAYWDEYQAAYETVLERCNTDQAPWYVIPSDRKWYRTLAIADILRDTLREMDMKWPEPDFDVTEQKRRLGA